MTILENTKSMETISAFSDVDPELQVSATDCQILHTVELSADA